MGSKHQIQYIDRLNSESKFKNHTSKYIKTARFGLNNLTIIFKGCKFCFNMFALLFKHWCYNTIQILVFCFRKCIFSNWWNNHRMHNYSHWNNTWLNIMNIHWPVEVFVFVYCHWIAASLIYSPHFIHTTQHMAFVVVFHLDI